MADLLDERFQVGDRVRLKSQHEGPEGPVGTGYPIDSLGTVIDLNGDAANRLIIEVHMDHPAPINSLNDDGCWLFHLSCLDRIAPVPDLTDTEALKEWLDT